MTVIPKSLAFGCLSWSLAVTVLAQAPALDVKMGLWEMTSTTNVGGEMPAIDTSKLSPERKAAVEAAMKGMMGTHSNVTKTCMTKEKFDTSAFVQPEEAGTTCKQTLVANTRSVLDTKVVCTGTQPMTAEMHFNALSTTSVAGVIKTAYTVQGRTMTGDTTLKGRWLSADCGNVK